MKLYTWSWQLIVVLIFPVDLVMLNTRLELMQKKHFFSWMGHKLMEMLFEQGSPCLHGRRFPRLQKLFLLLKRKMVLTLKRMLHTDKEILLRAENLFHHHVGDPH